MESPQRCYLGYYVMNIEEQKPAKIIKAVRHLDLSNRPWDNGYNLPQDENDPIEDHHYLRFFARRGEIARWKMEFYEETVAPNWNEKRTFSVQITLQYLNEYGWFFNRRDGSVRFGSQ